MVYRANNPIKLEMKQDDIEWDAWFTDKMAITHLALLEDHLLDYSQRSADDQCKNCMLWHCEKLKGYSTYEAPKFFEGDHESTYQKVGELAQAVQGSLGNLAQSEALDYAKKVRDLRYELVGYGIYDFAIVQKQDRHFEELEKYIKEAEMTNSMVTKSELAVIEARLKPFRDEIKGLDTPEKWADYGAKVIKLWKEWDLPQAATPPEYYVLSMQWQVAPSRLTARRLKEALEEDLGVSVFPGIASQLLDKYAYFEMSQETPNNRGAEMKEDVKYYVIGAYKAGKEDVLLRIRTLEPRLDALKAEFPDYERFWAIRGERVELEQESPKTIQQLLQEQEIVEQAQKARPKDIIFWKTTIEKHYQPKEAFYPDSFRARKVNAALVTLGCLKKHKWHPEKLECVPTQTLHRTIVPRTEKYIKEAEEWEAIDVPTQHRETEVGIEPKELAVVTGGS